MKIYGMVAMLTILGSNWVHAAGAFWQADINKIVTDTNTGLCAVWVIPGPQDNGLVNCDTRWINFDCSGDFQSKSQGITSFNLAQLAFVTSRPISVYVNDTNRIDVGTTQYCYAEQVQVNP